MRKRQIQVRVIRNNFGQNEFSSDIIKKEADMSMLNTSIFVGKITEKETNTSACYTGIILVTK